jgi:hypothetical protein
VTQDFAFGVRNIQGTDNWNAAQCIHGQPHERELVPDKDLGRSIKLGCTNVIKRPEDENRIFGTPTIRTDIPYKAKRSVADYNVSINFYISHLNLCRTMEMNLRL